MRKETKRFFFFFLFCSGVLFANPQGMQVSSGDASLTCVDSNTVHIQTGDHAVLHWDQFSIGAGELTKFIQSSSSSSVINRVTGNESSAILGTLQANGHVYLLNPNGVLIGEGGKIECASFWARPSMC